MSDKNVDRRDFLKKSIAASAGASLAFKSFEEQNLMARMAENPGGRGAARNKPGSGSDKLPRGKIKDLEISRIICGGNLIGGYAHSRDLLYASSLLKHYFTDEKILETLQICEENGVNTIITNTPSARLLKKYWDEKARNSAR